VGRDDALLALAASPEVRAWLAQPGVGVYVVRSDGHIVWASPSMKAATGRAPDELVGRNGWEVFVPREVLEPVAEFRARLDEGDATIWMPLAMPGGGRDWYRVASMARAGGIVCAFHREPDPAQRYLHWEPHIRRL
jgi:PAS domain S-box-containing protein